MKVLTRKNSLGSLVIQLRKPPLKGILIEKGPSFHSKAASQGGGQVFMRGVSEEMGWGPGGEGLRGIGGGGGGVVDGRNRATVVAEALVRVIATIQIIGVRWQSYLPQNTESGPHRPCGLCAAT